MSELRIYDGDLNQLAIIGISSTAAGATSSEGIAKLVDGSTSTKYCAVNSDFVITGTIDADKISYYEWYTANDLTGRDPLSWTFEISVDNENWMLFDSASNVSITTSRRVLAYTTKYTTFKPWQMGKDGYPALINAPVPPDVEVTNIHMWRITEGVNGGYPYVGTMPMPEPKGAFRKAEKLERVYIPESVKRIGAEAFRYTALKTVRIAPDCEYSPTSFPEGCEVEFYGGGGDYGQLYDRDGYAVLDCEAARIYVKE